MSPIGLIQKRIANISVGSSTVRGQPKETVNIARNYLKSIKLQEFSNMNDEGKFKILLDKHTTLLKEQLPSKSWGISRKVLNIFMFQASHDILLNRNYFLDSIIPYLELPLDNPNAKRLVKLVRLKNIRLNWRNIYSLDAETNKQFQEFAKRYAHDNFQCDRCYLDVYWWRSEVKSKVGGFSNFFVASFLDHIAFSSLWSSGHITRIMRISSFALSELRRITQILLYFFIFDKI